MLAADKNAVICDLAEVYHIYDYHGVPVKLLGTLVSGLGPDSRIRMKLEKRRASTNTIILARIHDLLAVYIYGAADKTAPDSVFIEKDMYIDRPKKKASQGYSSGEEFKKAWISMTNRVTAEEKDA